MIIDCAGKALDLSQPQVMGILNVTPDSFSDAGQFVAAGAAIQHARQMVAEGAAIIDVGGESTRPGAQPVSIQQELDRVIPVIEAIANEISVPISIDTSKPEVMRAAVAAGAGMVNDVCALQADGAMQTVVDLAVPVCLMHMQGEPRSMQSNPQYRDVVEEILAFLGQRVAQCEAAGIARKRIILDPGFGFGKTLEHNLELLRRLEAFQSLQLPLLVGMSRKSMFGALLDRPVEQRLPASLAAAVIAVLKGARIIRAHDVAATVDAVRVCQAVAGEKA
jgi:dihydropteroate synthase